MTQGKKSDTRKPRKTPTDEYYRILGLCNEARALNAQERYREAAETYEKLLGTEPQSGDICFFLGMCLSMDGQERKALKCFEKARKLGTYDPELLLYQAAQVHNLLGEYEEAIRSCQEAIEIRPGLTDALILLGNLFLEYEPGHYSQAQLWYQRAVESDAEELEALVKLGICLEGRHQKEEARKCFEKVVDLVGSDDYTAIARRHLEGLK